MSAPFPVIEPEPYRSRIHRTQEALGFVKRLLARRGLVSEGDLARLRREGFGDTEIEAIVALAVSGPFRGPRGERS